MVETQQSGWSKWFKTETEGYSVDRAWLKHNEVDVLAGLRLISKDTA